MSNENNSPPVTANHCLFPKLIRMNNTTIKVRYKGSCLKQYKVTFIPKI